MKVCDRAELVGTVPRSWLGAGELAQTFPVPSMLYADAGIARSGFYLGRECSRAHVVDWLRDVFSLAETRLLVCSCEACAGLARRIDTAPVRFAAMMLDPSSVEAPLVFDVIARGGGLVELRGALADDWRNEGAISQARVEHRIEGLAGLRRARAKARRAKAARARRRCSPEASAERRAAARAEHQARFEATCLERHAARRLVGHLGELAEGWRPLWERTGTDER